MLNSWAIRFLPYHPISLPHLRSPRRILWGSQQFAELGGHLAAGRAEERSHGIHGLGRELRGTLEAWSRARLKIMDLPLHKISDNGGPLRALKTSTWNFQPFPSQVSNRSRRLLPSHRPPQEGAEEARQQGRQQRVQPPGWAELTGCGINHKLYNIPSGYLT